MPDLDWQLAIVLAAVLWAMGVLTRRIYRMFTRSAQHGCSSGACGNCPTAATPERTPPGFVPVDELKLHKR